MARTTGAQPPVITVKSDKVLIEHLEVPRADVASYLTARPEEQRAEALVRAIEIGVFCLERVEMAHDVEFVRREIQSFLNEVDTRTKKIAPEIQEKITQKLGTGPGQVLAPIAEVVRDARKTVRERLDEVKQLLDLSDKKSDLSQVFDKIRGVLDPTQKGSIQDAFQQALIKLTNQDGELGAFVKQRVSDAIQPLQNQMTKIYEKVVGDTAAEGVVAATTAKGRPYEEQVTELLTTAFSHNGVSVEHVGVDNQPGDVLLTFPSEGIVQREIRVVVEVRDRANAYGHKRISVDLEAAMQQRKSQGAVYVAHSLAGLAAEIGDWGEGRTQTGPYVAATHENLSIAVRWVAAILRLEAMRTIIAPVDIPAVEPQLQRIHTALRRLSSMQTHLKAGRTALDAVSDEGDALRDEVRDALRQIEDALRLPAWTQNVDALSSHQPVA